MKHKINLKNLLLLSIYLALATAGCGPYQRDQQIKADLTMKAKEDVNFAGLHFTVEDRNLSIWGSCPTFKSKHAVMQKLSSIHVIKNIDERITIRPVTIGNNFSIKQEADSILAKHPGAWAEVNSNVVTIYGNFEKNASHKVMSTITEKLPAIILINKSFSNPK